MKIEAPLASRALIGPADLIAAFATGDVGIAEAIAEQLGMQYHPPDVRIEVPTQQTNAGSAAAVVMESSVRPDSTGYPDHLLPLSIYMAVHYALRPDQTKASAEQEQPQPQPQNQHEIRWQKAPASGPKFAPLSPWSTLSERLKSALSDSVNGWRTDIPRLVDQVARRNVVTRLPRTNERSVGQLHVIIDESTRLTTFFEDQQLLIQQLRVLYPVAAVSIQSVSTLDDLDDVCIPKCEGHEHILVAGDLGVLSSSDRLLKRWQLWGKEARKMGSSLSAIVPCAITRVPVSLHRVFQIVSWQRDPMARIHAARQRKELLHHLFVLASVCRRIEPGLLRDLRCLIPDATDASLESDFWSSPLLTSRHPRAATLNPAIARDQLRPLFERLPPEQRKQALWRIREWRKDCPPGLWLMEVLCLSPESQDLLPDEDLQDARRCFQTVEHLRRNGTPDQRTTYHFLQHNYITHYTNAAYRDIQIGSMVRRARFEVRPEIESIPNGTDPQEMPPGEVVQAVCVEVDDAKVTLKEKDPYSVDVKPLVKLSSSNAVFEVAFQTQGNKSDFWKTGKPDFVSNYGRDKSGAWCEFQIPRQHGDGVVTQRMRWIPAGTFLMGSPQGERGRGSDEIQHEVKLSRGFWLADTACTQELWEAVTGDTPSHFKGDRLPVEQVSYDEVIKFVRALEKLVPELAPALPTEAQWEYACRARTETPFGFGDTITTDQVNFDGRYPYGDSPKGEYRQKTVEVKSLPPNPWGLYEMHGNVWEWCRDWYGEYSAEPQVDPTGPVTGSNRVVRGGGWFNLARHVRSASRSWGDPGGRSNALGFRLLSSASAEPTEAAEVPVAEQGSKQTRFGAADENFSGKTVRVENGATVHVKLSGHGPMRLRSNLEEVVLQRTTKPNWAVAFGCDQFGTYADFQVPPKRKGAPVRQRMRWIPPGRFRMGSPADEPGRYDNETQHDVTISSGFWMFDTSCTQALWLAVMAGKNPSHFTDLTRPVEQVNWDQATEFATKLTSKLPELRFSLPTEAQWEYACRAGTTTSIYSGPLEILGDANAPALDPIAWYGGNCGVNFDLSNGPAVTWLSNKQYEFEKGGTRQVKQKHPNPWGLYDMLGNVWEWCHDWHSDYSSEAQVDPIGAESGSARVVRGGGWSSLARDVRSACRGWDDPGGPGDRDDYLGFRLLSSASPDRNQEPNK